VSLDVRQRKQKKALVLPYIKSLTFSGSKNKK